MTKQQRLDQAMVARGLVPSRSRATDFIKGQQVFINNKLAKKAGVEVSESDVITIQGDHDFVSRGALKIKKAHEEFKFAIEGKVLLDIGASTGGFTDYFIKQGAKQSFCIDVGTGQLHPSLRKHPNVVNIEKTDFRDYQSLDQEIDFFVMDVSFISSKICLSHLKNLQKSFEGVVLFKPQFEVGREHLGKNGVVAMDAGQSALEDFKEWLGQEEFQVQGITTSPIKGKNGNQEYLVWIKR